MITKKEHLKGVPFREYMRDIVAEAKPVVSSELHGRARKVDASWISSAEQNRDAITAALVRRGDYWCPEMGACVMMEAASDEG